MWDFTKQYGLEVIVNGVSVDEYPHTDGNTYVEGRPGSNYLLRISNNSYEEILAIPAIDGLSVFDGKEAGPDSAGYVIGAQVTIDVPGWTLNNNAVGKFEFGAITSSYSAQSNKGTSNVGVIGLMIFRPKPIVARQSNQNSILHGQIFGSSAVASRDWLETSCDALISTQEMGTGFGDVQQFNTVKTTFEKRDSNNPDAIIAMYYDSARGLEKRGIRIGVKHNPTPFPTYTKTMESNNNPLLAIKGCTPPPNWVKK